MEDTTKILLSGEHSRRRGYLTNVIVTLNALAATGTITIWSTLVQWDLLYGQAPNHMEFAIRFAWASCISSILLGLWRFYVHFLDASIIRLYPVIYLCELNILPDEISSIKPPKLPQNVNPVKKDSDFNEIEWHNARNIDFGGRGHQFIDTLVIILVLIFSVSSLSVSYKLSIISFALQGQLHLVGWLLIGNAVGLILVIIGWYQWKNIEVKWPVSKQNASNNSNAQPVT